MTVDPFADMFDAEGNPLPPDQVPPVEPGAQTPPPAATPEGAGQASMEGEDFWATAGEPDEPESLPFVTPEQKDALIGQGATLVMTAVRDADTEHGPTWFVDVVLPDGQIATLTLKNGSGLYTRDHYFGRAREWFQTHPGGRVPFVLAKKGRTIVVKAPGA